MDRLFGTDGVRGTANSVLTVELAMQVAQAAAVVLGGGSRSGTTTTAVVGRDPRISGEVLESAVVAGLTSFGVDVVRVGVLPTPAVAHLTAKHGAALGVMISASHNPMPDNGIKIFGTGGRKLPDAVEDEIEAQMPLVELAARPSGAQLGRIRSDDTALGTYLDHLAVAAPTRLDGLRVVVDCANGAAAEAAPHAYRAAGAHVIAINAEPSGLNINDDCGSTHLDVLRAAVTEHGADLGIAHDGDADRCLAVDAAGNVVDGDAIMAILAIAMRDAGELTGDTLVTTVMSNLGLHIAMRDAGIETVSTSVGDRYVLEALADGGFALGGEQSGHIVLPGFATTGDGTLTALRLMGTMATTGRSLTELASVVTVLPQVLLNVAVDDKSTVACNPDVVAAVAAAEAELGDTGRVLLRPSGTEELVRVMVEAPGVPAAERVARELAEVVAAARPVARDVR
ncbi:phosphoglucosamine mutase [Rhodococcus rhodnii]|uniref:Phosphoglucosamine mutase n=2 Tax=Rhodococcus rhodnii TaxID=38312 RepID=R7WRX7_9NOCA|nr:phosphoglucosamine mutase [Rhodococcus rhodnii]EOM78073.1 phosphoglucosamine mutase [Rhodococcus rhodnii LMG 5362]TXG90437.1 phosphoglucosamine mutase [Rhodococcus rhodnii]